MTNNLSDPILGLIQMLGEQGVDFQITSGYRQGAKTKQGNVSKHGLGEAIDIVGNFDDLRSALYTNPHLVNYMTTHGIGVLDETTPEMLARTGGSGAHLHIGTDKIARAGLAQNAKPKEVEKEEDPNADNRTPWEKQMDFIWKGIPWG